VASAFNKSCVEECTVLTCSCTAAGFYWSSTSWTGNPAFVWQVGFEFGSVSTEDKNDGFASNGPFVRAVRGGCVAPEFGLFVPPGAGPDD